MLRRLEADSGFTLSELTVVMVLLGVMLSVTYAAMKVVYDGQAASNRQVWFAREIGAPLDQLDQLFSQNTNIASATTQTVTLLIDRPRQVGSTLEFDNLEQHSIAPQVNPLTGRYEIVDTIHGTDAMWNPTVVVRSVSWADDYGNRQAGVPLFVFKDKNGAEVAPANAPTDAAQVLITIISVREGRSFRGTRTVVFRNK